MAKKTHVMLRRDWPAPFSRSVRDKKGNVKSTLTFEPGVPVELTDSELKAIESHIGNNLHVVEIDKSGRAREVISEAEREEAAKAMAEKGREVESLTDAVKDLQKQLEEAKGTIADQASEHAVAAAEAAATIAEYEELLGDDDEVESLDEGAKKEPGA